MGLLTLSILELISRLDPRLTRFELGGEGMERLLLIVDAIRRAYTQTAHIGSTFIFVDALNDRAMKMYQSLGFTPFQDTPSQLFIPMSTIEQLIR